jgi:glycerate 2-kinase
LAAAEAVTTVLATTTARDRVLLLLSGGASALLPSPVDGISLADLQTVTEHLLRAGATICEINAVRKHLSRLSGGQLARLAQPASVVALILSDVVGDPLDVIASGPTAPDPTTYATAQAILARYDLVEQIPPSVLMHLEEGTAERIAETPKPGDPVFANVTNVIVGSNRLAALAATVEAKRLGYNTLLLTTFMEGEAREVARVTAALAKGIRTYGDPVQRPACLVWGGETTVTVRGQGKGGRNQELALAAALAMEGLPDVSLLALATDGTDGPTDAAGAIVDGHTAEIARESGWDPAATLVDNNAYPLLDAVGALLRTGPTGTNVNDIAVLLVV